MKGDIALIWADALESGDYKQGVGQLKHGDSFCCLGVLCDLYSSTCWGDLIKDEVEFLPKLIQKWAGMQSRSGYIRIGGKEYNLAQMNDEGITFDEIADIIRKYYKDL